MDGVIDYFNIYKKDRLCIMNKLYQVFNCDIEFGNYKYTYNGKKVNKEIYYFIIKQNNYTNDDLRSINNYLYFTVTDILSINIFDSDYINDFTNRHNFIFRSYKNEILQYINSYITLFCLIYDTDISIFDNSIYIKIITKNSYYIFTCKYSLYDFKLLKNFINDITLRHKRGKL